MLGLIGAEIPCPGLHILLLCEHHLHEHINQSWLGGQVGAKAEGGDQLHKKGSTAPPTRIKDIIPFNYSPKSS